MSIDQMDNKKQALEEIFFAKQNRELIEKMKAQATQEETCSELAKVSGISDRDVLNKLYEAGVRPATMTALSLLPLILVAWADGNIDQKERDAIQKAAIEQGIDDKNPAYQYLNSWLKEAPPADIFEAWQHYVEGLGQALGKEAYHQLHVDIMKRTRAVANAAGGFLGLGSKTSASELAVIDQLDAVFKSSTKAS